MNSPHNGELLRQQRLRDRYFSLEQEQEEELRLTEEQSRMLAGYSQMIATEGWKDLRVRLDAMLIGRDVEAGTEQEMLYQIGRRDGLRDVVSLLRAIEQELRDEQARGN